jgi:hypothetical protein
MFSRTSSIVPLLVAQLVLATASHAFAQLAAKSPFMPPQAAASATPTAGAPLEYRGLMETREGLQFRIYNPTTKAGTWIKANERNAEFDVTIKQHDGDQKTLTIEHQGKTLTLAERESKVVSSGIAGQAMPPPVPVAPSNVPAAVTQAVVLNPNAADEQRRLDAVAAEVARRRAMREQAAQQVNQGIPPQMNVAQPVPVPMQPQQNMPVAPARAYQLPMDQNTPRGRAPGPNGAQQQQR